MSLREMSYQELVEDIASMKAVISQHEDELRRRVLGRSESTEPVHWAGEPGEGPTSLHGNGATSFARTSGDEDEVTCKLCLTLLAHDSTVSDHVNEGQA